jgi:FkbM family methyltransferase
MWINHLVQVEVPLPNGQGRFWMDNCGGRDQVAMTVQQAGWAAYEPPLPTLIAAWCAALTPVFIDVGANTGFYSLLALASGATQVQAFEPVLEIAQVLAANARISELDHALTCHVLALGESKGEASLYFPLATHGLVETSASLNPKFRAQHEGVRRVALQRLDAVLPTLAAGPVLIKIDVESLEPAVLTGAVGLLQRCRPAVICEILPGAELGYFEAFCRAYGYQHYALDSGLPVSSPALALSLEQRDHVFLPIETAAQWLHELLLV